MPPPTPGFSFVQILSPCVTFRDDQQKTWKAEVRDALVDETHDPARAARRLMSDDGLNVGILYRGKRPAYAPKPLADFDPSHLETEFAV